MGQLEREMLMSVDEFKQPKVLLGKDAIGTLLVRLIQLEPGTISTRPKMGVGLLSNYRFCDEAKVAQLEGHIREQIKTYLPEYQGVKVYAKLNQDGKLRIDIVIDGTLYRYEADVQTDNNVLPGLQSI